MVAKAELHDTRRMSNRAPPHDSPPKFEMGCPSGGLYCVSTGKEGLSGVTAPDSTPIEPVTTLNVDPGKKRSCHARPRSGASALASRNVLTLAASFPLWLASGLGSYDGKLQRPRIEPSRGSRTTTEPLCGPSA